MRLRSLRRIIIKLAILLLALVFLCIPQDTRAAEIYSNVSDEVIDEFCNYDEAFSSEQVSEICQEDILNQDIEQIEMLSHESSTELFDAISEEYNDEISTEEYVVDVSALSEADVFTEAKLTYSESFGDTKLEPDKSQSITELPSWDMTWWETSDFRATSTPNGTILSWNPMPGANGYIIGAIQNGNQYAQLGYTFGTSFTDWDASDSIYSYYWLFPYTIIDGKVSRGNAVSYYVYGIRQLNVPINVKAQSKPSAIEISWDAVTGADGYMVKVLRGNGPAQFLTDTKELRFVDTMAPENSVSFYWVCAYRQYGELRRPGAMSKYVYGMPLPQASLELDTKEITIPVNGRKAVKAIVTGTSKDLVWWSNNTEIAEVDENGFVIGKRPGVATITVSAGDIQASCIVNIVYSSAARYQAYWEIIQSYEQQYGQARWDHKPGMGDTFMYMYGLCYLNLVDFDNDGEDELLLAFQGGESESEYYAEIWGYNKQENCAELWFHEPIRGGSDAGIKTIELSKVNGMNVYLGGTWGFTEHLLVYMYRDGAMRLIEDAWENYRTGEWRNEEVAFLAKQCLNNRYERYSIFGDPNYSKGLGDSVANMDANIERVTNMRLLIDEKRKE